MSNTNDQYHNNFIDNTEDVAQMDFSDLLQSNSLDEFLEPFKTNEDLPNLSPSSISLDSYQQSPSEFSPQSNNQAFSGMTTTVLYNTHLTLERLHMIEQPYQGSKLRYRTDYIREKGRLGAVGNKNPKSKLKGPAISIPKYYLNSNHEYYIRISLVTTKYNKTNLHYFHPYELEHAKNEEFNDRQTNSVWYPIEPKDSIKNFPLLRIVKKKAFHVQKLDHLDIFDCQNQVLSNTPRVQPVLKKEIDVIKEYNLEKSHLAFTIGKKLITNGQLSMVLYADTTIFSDEIDENDGRQSDTETDTESSSERSRSSSATCYIYKYAPRSGVVGNNDEILIFLEKKLELNKYGGLEVTFECDTSKGRWSQRVVDLDIRDRMLSFKTPSFPYSITNPKTVDIVLRQDNRILGLLKYDYLPARQ